MSGPIDREEWDDAWRARMDRSLPGGCRLDPTLSARPTDGPVAVTIAADPPRFAGRVRRGSPSCPVCGESTSGLPRVGASLDVRYASGFACFVGVWVHEGCLERCAVLGAAAHIPW